MTREMICKSLGTTMEILRAQARYTPCDLTEGERALIRAAADSVAAAYRIISTGDPDAK